MCEQHSLLYPLWKAHKRHQFTIQVWQLTDCLFLFTALLQLCILKNETVTVYTIGVNTLGPVLAIWGVLSTLIYIGNAHVRKKLNLGSFYQFTI